MRDEHDTTMSGTEFEHIYCTSATDAVRELLAILVTIAVLFFRGFEALCLCRDQLLHDETALLHGGMTAAQQFILIADAVRVGIFAILIGACVWVGVTYILRWIYSGKKCLAITKTGISYGTRLWGWDRIRNVNVTRQDDFVRIAIVVASFRPSPIFRPIEMVDASNWSQIVNSLRECVARSGTKLIITPEPSRAGDHDKALTDVSRTTVCGHRSIFS